MNKDQCALRFSRLFLCAAIFIAVTPILARAQVAQDCTVPSPLPKGPVTIATSNCAILHAQYLYTNRCVDGADCGVKNAAIAPAYRESYRIFDRYLADRDQANGGPPQSRSQQANDAFWRGFLLERSNEDSKAMQEYVTCKNIAEGPAPQYLAGKELSPDPAQRDAKDLDNCTSGILRLYCVANSDSSICRSSGTDASTSIKLDVGKQGGGETEVVVVVKTQVGGGTTKMILPDSEPGGQPGVQPLEPPQSDQPSVGGTLPAANGILPTAGGTGRIIDGTLPTRKELQHTIDLTSNQQMNKLIRTVRHDHLEVAPDQ